jgi:hypothetical protein
MPASIVTASFDDREQAARAVARLEAAGVSASDIRLFAAPAPPDEQMAEDPGVDPARDDPDRDALGTGAVLGADEQDSGNLTGADTAADRDLTGYGGGRHRASTGIAALLTAEGMPATEAVQCQGEVDRGAILVMARCRDGVATRVLSEAAEEPGLAPSPIGTDPRNI